MNWLLRFRGNFNYEDASLVLDQFDLYRWFCVLYADVLMEMIKKVTANPAIPGNLLTSIRVVTNLFKNSCYYNWLYINQSEVGIRSIFIFLVWPGMPSSGLSLVLSIVCLFVCTRVRVGGWEALVSVSVFTARHSIDVWF